jgi:hypothetical protein
MNLETFVATRTASDDLGKTLGFPEWYLDEEGNERAAKGFVYTGDCAIEQMDDGRFYLLIGNCEWIDTDISKLEAELWQWATDEQLFS